MYIYIYIYICLYELRIRIYIICTFRYSFIESFYGQCSYYITLRTREKTPQVFGRSQRVWVGSFGRNRSVTDRVHGV